MTRLQRPSGPRLLDLVRARMRRLGMASRTELAYIGWIRGYLRYQNMRHPREMGNPELEQFLTSLAVERHASSRTQNQSLSALLFLYKQVLQDYRVQDQVPGPIFLTTMFSIRAH